ERGRGPLHALLLPQRLRRGEVALEVRREDLLLAVGHERRRDAALGLVRDVVADDRQLPGLLLRLRRRAQGAGGRRPLLPGDGVVAGELGGDRVLIGAAGGGERAQQRPAQ